MIDIRAKRDRRNSLTQSGAVFAQDPPPIQSKSQYRNPVTHQRTAPPKGAPVLKKG